MYLKFIDALNCRNPWSKKYIKLTFKYTEEKKQTQQIKFFKRKKILPK